MSTNRALKLSQDLYEHIGKIVAVVDDEIVGSAVSYESLRKDMESKSITGYAIFVVPPPGVYF